MTRYLVERYIPGDSVEDVRAAVGRLVAAVAEMAAEGTCVRYVRSTVIWADETCFCEFEAATREAVEWANERANVSFARILPAVRLSQRTGRRTP